MTWTRPCVPSKRKLTFYTPLDYPTRLASLSSRTIPPPSFHLVRVSSRCELYPPENRLARVRTPGVLPVYIMVWLLSSAALTHERRREMLSPLPLVVVDVLGPADHHFYLTGHLVVPEATAGRVPSSYPRGFRRQDPYFKQCIEAADRNIRRLRRARDESLVVPLPSSRRRVVAG